MDYFSGGLAIQFPHHKVYDIVGIALGVNATQVPTPLPFDVIKDE